MQEWKKNIRQVVPYVPGEQPKKANVIKLNTNENPYPPSPKVKEQCAKICAETEELRLYPDPTAGMLVEAIAKYKGLDSSQVFVGVGSDDVLAMAFLTFFNSEKPIFFPDITYSFYDVWADLFKIPYDKKPLDENFMIKKDDYYWKNGGVVFPNPNAPTGVLMPLDEIEDIISHNQDVIVIVDEAYVDFGGHSAQELLSKYENLLVVQTFSKSRSMAGMRIGYAMGSAELIKALNDVKYSFNSYTMNRTSILLGTASIEDDVYFKETVEKIVNTREWFKAEMKKLGFTFPDSKANFLFASHPKVPAKEIFEAAREKDIYVRYSPHLTERRRCSTLGASIILIHLTLYAQRKESAYGNVKNHQFCHSGYLLRLLYLSVPVYPGALAAEGPAPRPGQGQPVRRSDLCPERAAGHRRPDRQPPGADVFAGSAVHFRPGGQLHRRHGHGGPGGRGQRV